MTSKAVYIISAIVIILLLFIIYWYREKFDSIIPPIPDEGTYYVSSGKLEYPGNTNPVADIANLRNRLNELADSIPTNIDTENIVPVKKSDLTISPILPPCETIFNKGNTENFTDSTNIATQLKGNLDAISQNYFKNEIKPALEINRWIDNLQTRLDNIQLKLAEKNIKPADELVFY